MESTIETAGLVEEVDGSFVTRDGLTLSTYRLHAQSSCFEPVILIHGLADHSRSLPYRRLGSLLASRGFEVFAFDRRGSGRSHGIPNHAPCWEDLRDDLRRFVDIVEDQCGRLPSLIGLSFGGLQALDFALDSPESLHTCVALAPALDLSGTSSWLRAIIRVLAKVRPTLSVDPGLDDSGIARDDVLRKAYRDDPLWRTRTTTSFAAFALEAVERIHGRANDITAPLLVFHGTADRLVPILGTRNVFPRFGSVDKVFIELEGAYHALPIEPEGDAIAVQIADWLTARCGRSPR